MSKFTTFLTTVGLMLCALTMSAQLTVSLSPANVTVDPNDDVFLDVIVDGFTDVGSCQFNINWDETQLEYDTITDITLPGLSLSNLTLIFNAPSTIIMAWTDPNSMETTVPTGSIFRIKMKALTGGVAPVTFSGTEAFGIINGNFDEFVVTDVPAEVTITGGVVDGPTEINIADISAETGTSTCVDVTVNNFDSIATMQYTMEWDPNILQFDSVTNFGLLGLSSNNFGLPNASMGLLPVAWNDSTAQSFQTLPDGALLYQICFSMIGDGGTSSTVVINDSLTNVQVTIASPGGPIPIDVVTNPGTVTVTGTGGSVFVFAGDEMGENGDTIRIPFKVRNFEMLSSLQFSVNWDTSILMYHAIENFILPGGVANSFALNATDDGELALTWAQGSLTGETLADSTTIFDIAFIIKGETGERDFVMLTDDPRDREATQEDGAGNGTIIPVVTQNGIVDVTGLPMNGFAISASSVTGEVGETVCIDVNVQDFFTMESAQWAFGYDVSVLEFTGSDNIATAFAGIAILELNDGLIRILWATPDGNPVTYPNGSPPAFQICFEILAGNPGDSYPVIFTTDPNPPALNIEFASEGSVVINDFTLVPGSIVVGGGTDPCMLSQTNVVSNISCNGAGDGSITLNVSGAVGTPTFNWTSDTGFSSTDEDISTLAAGIYSVTITDPGTPDCELIVSGLTITDPTAISASATGSTVTCVGDTDGTITVTASGGTGTLMYSIDGSNFQASNIFSGQAANNYTITVQDANMCSTTTTATISAPAPITVMLAATQASCNGGMDAMITVTAGGGDGNYMYSINGATAVASNVFTGLSAGGYIITVSDGNDCTGTANTTVSELSGITASAMTTPVDCNGDTNGTITVTASGGAGTFMYALDGGTPQASNIFNGVAGGSHTVTVSDGSGCDATINADIVEPTIITISASAPTLNCNGDETTITVIASGGTGALTYSLDGTNFQNDNTFENQSGGNYTVTVRDANDCENTTPVNIVEPTLIMASANASDTSCNGDDDGTITVTASGGTGALEYSINGTDFDLSNTFMGQPAGNYTITIRDANNCEVTTTATIGEPDAIVINSSSTQASCNGATDGTITVVASGGEPTYIYSIDGITFQTSNVFNNVAAGTYTITVRDDNSCENTTTEEVTEASGLDASATSSGESCSGAADGIIIVNVTGGSGNYEYTLDGGTAQSSNTFTSVIAGMHTIEVTDLTTGCTDSFTEDVDGATGVTATASVEDITCNGDDDGVISVTASGGSGNYEYSNNNGASFQSSDDFGGLTPGTYTIIVRDDNGCSTTFTETVDEPSEIMISADATDVTCNGGDDGTVTITASGGTGILEFSNGGGFSATNVFTGLSEGTVTYTVRDGNGCIESIDVTVDEPAALAITASITPDVTGVEGEIDITVSPADNYMYTWTSTNGSGLDPAAGDQTGLSSGDYFVTATNADGCEVSESFTVPNTSTPGITNVDIDPVSCNGGSNGRIIIEVLGGTPPYDYNWSCSNSSSNVAAGLSAGICSVTVTDDNGVTVTDSYTITEPTAILLNAIASPVTCTGNNDGSITLTVSGGTPGTAPAYTFDWDNAPDIQNPTGLAPGNYMVTVTDANGCTETTSVEVTESSAISLSTVNPTNVLCQGESTGEIDIEVTGGTMPYQYSWENVSAQGTELSDNQDINGLFAGNYIVIVTDDNDCTFTSNPIALSEPNPIAATPTVNNVTCNGANNGSITLDISGGTGTYDVAWNTGNGSSLTAGIYFATVSDDNNCQLTVGPVTVTQPASIIINETITPVIAGGDGEIQLSVSGGTPDGNGNYFYNWSPINSTASGITGLDAGEHCVTVTDANGCNAEKCYDLSCPLSVDMSNTEINNVTCNGGADGSINLSVICGDGNYTYSWTGPNFTSSSENISGLSAGTYSLDIEDGNGSTFSRTFAITEPQAITVSNVIITPESGVGCNGGINITVNGGMPPYTYQWSNGSNIEDPTDLCKGSYGVNIIDANGCFASVDGYVVGAGPLVISSSSVDPVSCSGNSDGSITIQVFGGCEPYTFTLPNGTTQTALTPNEAVTFDDLGVGTVTINITDLGGQSMSQTFMVGEPAPIVINQDAIINNTDPTGTNCNGAINISVAGGQGPYSYQWSNGAVSEDVSGLCHLLSPYSVTVTDANNCVQVMTGIEVDLGMTFNAIDIVSVSCPGATDGAITVDVVGGQPSYDYVWDDQNINSPIRTDLAAGIYNVMVFDASGDFIVSGNIIVGEPAPINIVLTTTNPTTTSNSGSVTAAVTGGTPGYTYSWSTGDTSPAIGGLGAGTYSVTVFDSRGCQSINQVTLTTNPDDIEISIDGESCVGSCDADIFASASFGTAPYSYVWSDGQTTSTAFNVCSGSYTIQVTDATGAVMTMGATVNAATAMSATIETTTSTGTDGTIEVIVSGGTAPYSYQWNTPRGDTTRTVSGLEPGTYFVIVTDANGCRLEPAPSGEVGVETDCFNARDIITPTSSDNRNDVFIIACALDFDNTLEIYNRWGQLVYEATNYDNTWNGTTVDGNELPEGAYFWVLKYRDDNGEPQQVKGYLTILR